jgi:hypothetical protein
MIHGALLVSFRLCAFILGCIAFYLAFFLYEDDQGKLQNRIENLWVSVHDRARETDSLFVALINKSTRAVVSVSNVFFGKKLFSVQMVSVSMNASMLLILLTSFLMMIADATSSPDKRQLIFFTPFTLVVAACLFCAIRFAQRSLVYLTLVPVLAFMVSLSVSTTPLAGFRYFIAPVLLILSVALDAVALACIRKTFALIAAETTLKSIVKSILVLMLICVASEALPMMAIQIDAAYHHAGLPEITDLGGNPAEKAIRSLALGLFALDLTTFFYALVPAVVLFGLLLHKLFWPVLSRAIYPVARHKIFVNQKAMAAVGILAFTFAFGLEHVGAKEILKLFSNYVELS